MLAFVEELLKLGQNVPDKNGTFRIDVLHCTNIDVQLRVSTQVSGIMTLHRNLRKSHLQCTRIHFMSIEDNKYK